MLQSVKQTAIRKNRHRDSVCKWNIAVIDDDPFFHFIMKTYANQIGVNLLSFASLADIKEKKEIQTFDICLVDYFIDDFNGIQIAEYLSSFFSEVPVVLISGQSLFHGIDQWPLCVKAFFPKAMGAKKILLETIFWLENHKENRGFPPLAPLH